MMEYLPWLVAAVVAVLVQELKRWFPSFEGKLLARIATVAVCGGAAAVITRGDWAAAGQMAAGMVMAAEVAYQWLVKEVDRIGGTPGGDSSMAD